MDNSASQAHPEENVTYPQDAPSYMNVKKPTQKEPVAPVQRESVITREDVPNPLFRIGVTLALLIPLLLIAAIYYGVIHP